MGTGEWRWPTLTLPGVGGRRYRSGRDHGVLSPEMARAANAGSMGELEADPAMDLWAAGIVCWELMTGVGRAMSDQLDYRRLINFRDP